ncbi:N-acetyltransferase [Terrabacter sp. NPDC080008]|uniref:N-acetyltransferase n=1 Tax=Terrabacter sp. NPDC080008 TaxID=3155176 RepID=UPI0034511004
MRELRPLTPDRVTDLVGGCAPCTFWQTVPHNGHSGPREPLDLLAEWVETVTSEWGSPGRVAYVDEQPAGHVLLAPARYVPRLAAFPTSPSDPSTLMLVTVMTTPEQAGIRKTLVQTAAKDALAHRARSLEAVGARPLAVSRHACVLDVPFLEKVGFRVERDHPAYPRMRIDLRTVVTLRDEVAEALSRALARVPGVHPAPAPHPNGTSRASVADARPERPLSR